jgi:hypothetical protein
VEEGARVTLPLNREILEANYDYLRTTPPFSKWNLPDGEDVQFVITRSRKTMGTHCLFNGKHIIEISRHLVGYTSTLTVLMAHEMVHAHQKMTKTDTPGVEHNAAFRQFGRQVCKYHGFDPHEF